MDCVFSLSSQTKSCCAAVIIRLVFAELAEQHVAGSLFKILPQLGGDSGIIIIAAARPCSQRAQLFGLLEFAGVQCRASYIQNITLQEQLLSTEHLDWTRGISASADVQYNSTRTY